MPEVSQRKTGANWYWIVGGVIAVVLFMWHYSFLQACKNYNDMGIFGAWSLVSHGCPRVGPYGANSNVFFYALLHPFT
jgi:hypothetical protein